MNLLDALRERVWIADGAMGTRLFEKGISPERCLEELNLSLPSVVEEIHREYRAAGAEIIETNTFGANAARLAAHGLEERVGAINIAAVCLARAAAGPDGIVAGAVGPLGTEPLTGPIDDARGVFAAQIEALAEAGADCILLETFRDLGEIAEAIRAAKAACNLPVIAQVSPDENGNLRDGIGPEAFVLKLIEVGADAIGCNCGGGPAPMLEVIRHMAQHATVPLTAQPSAGLPVRTSAGMRWPCSPEQMAQFAVELVHNGVRVAGGCCGTTPQHIEAIGRALKQNA